MRASADEGRSPFTKKGEDGKASTKIGEKIMDERVTIFADPQDPQLLSQPFDQDGLPVGRQVFVDKGVLKELYYSRFWAKKMSKPATGQPQGVKMAGDDAHSVDDLIKATERGVLVTRLWYLRQVDPRTILYTGLTRDGTFLIENGKISKAIRNFRFNDSPLFMLNNLEMLGRRERVAGTEQGGDAAFPSDQGEGFQLHVAVGGGLGNGRVQGLGSAVQGHARKRPAGTLSRPALSASNCEAFATRRASSASRWPRPGQGPTRTTRRTAAAPRGHRWR